ncbi:TonB-dependent receptor [Luteimonas gilva]|uniref:TonB-dependent receptor n=1 Tax=Luteimonas gilva TaxID=2572684 RepID=A0A4U5JNZ5_9GAMM|nr:carboxypeptidase regulatory-like domain-containing protein [Luteimonas gilva]TKR31005.1 TonB-dependent receptor [Luteimonas gilva]
MTHTNRVRLSKLSLGLIVALAAAPVFAQSTSSGIGGRVVGADGAPVAGAEVTITHVESGTVSRAVTDANGRYAARGLRVGGPYSVTINKAGAGTSSKNEVYLPLDQVAEVDAQLKNDVSTLEAVTVVGASSADVFQASNKGLSTTVSQRDLQNNPSPSRSIQDVARLDPRVVITDRARGEISALGQNSRFNNVTVDAVGVNDPFGLEANGLPTIGTPISVDTIEEYNISTANYAVTNRRSVGANINAVTKSGTNEFHGSAYYAFRNRNNMIGESPEGNKFQGLGREWTGGVTLGGPLIKDKLFFFANYEESHASLGSDFGPSDSSATNKIAGITQAQLDAVIARAKELGLIPGTREASSDLEGKRALVKIDWNINDDHRASFRYQRSREDEPIVTNGNGNNSFALSSYRYNKQRNTDNYVLNLYDDWSDSFSTETSLSYQKYDQTRSALAQQPQVGIAFGGTAASPQGPFINLGEDQFTHYNVLGVKTLNGFFAGIWYADDHTIKAGFDFQRDEYYNLFGRTQFGAYTFTYANFLAGGANPVYSQYDLYRPKAGYTLDGIAAEWTLSQKGFFVEDNWQVNDSLSVQYGFRYDVASTNDKPLYNPTFEQAFGFRNDATINGSRVIQPRFSFNYNFPTEKYQTQLRGGIGLFQGNSLGVWLTNPYQNDGLRVDTYSVRTYNPAVPFKSDPFGQVTPTVAANSQQAVDSLDPAFKQPTVWKASLAFDRELPWWGTVFSAEWQHLSVKDAIYYKNLNIGAPNGRLPDGRYNYYRTLGQAPVSNDARVNQDRRFAQAVTLLTNSGKGSADNISLTLRKPFADNWAASLGVSYGRATEVNPGTSSQASSNFSNNVWINPNEDVASDSNYAIDRRINASITWQHNFFGNYATAISAFYDGHTGQPYSWVFSNDANGDSYSQRDLVYIPNRGDVVFQAGTPQSVIDQFYAYIDSDDYLRQHKGEIATRNASRSPWINQIDLSIRQEIPGFFKGAKGELRIDVFNFANLLNDKWGREERIGFPFVRNLAGYNGVCGATVTATCTAGSAGKYIYTLPTTNGNYAPGQYIIYDDKAVSRWSILVTARYTF